MNQTLTVSIDAMGGDAGPGIVVDALVRSAQRHPGVKFLLHGDEAQLRPLLEKRGKLAAITEIRHSAERVRMDEKPSIVLRRGRNTSMWRAIECVATKEAEVAISAGNDARNGNPTHYPAFYASQIDGVMAVGALTPARDRALYSNTGSYVEISAPGGAGEAAHDHPPTGRRCLTVPRRSCQIPQQDRLPERRVRNPPGIVGPAA